MKAYCTYCFRTILDSTYVRSCFKIEDAKGRRSFLQNEIKCHLRSLNSGRRKKIKTEPLLRLGSTKRFSLRPCYLFHGYCTAVRCFLYFYVGANRVHIDHIQRAHVWGGVGGGVLFINVLWECLLDLIYLKRIHALCFSHLQTVEHHYGGGGRQWCSTTKHDTL